MLQQNTKKYGVLKIRHTFRAYVHFAKFYVALFAAKLLTPHS